MEKKNVSAKLLRIQLALREKYGEMPQDSLEKKKSIEDFCKEHNSINIWLIYNSLAKRLELESMLKRLQGENLQKIVDVLDKFEKEISL